MASEGPAADHVEKLASALRDYVREEVALSQSPPPAPPKPEPRLRAFVTAILIAIDVALAWFLLRELLSEELSRLADFLAALVPALAGLAVVTIGDSIRKWIYEASRELSVTVVATVGMVVLGFPHVITYHVAIDRPPGTVVRMADDGREIAGRIVTLNGFREHRVQLVDRDSRSAVPFDLRIERRDLLRSILSPREGGAAADRTAIRASALYPVLFVKDEGPINLAIRGDFPPAYLRELSGVPITRTADGVEILREGMAGAQIDLPRGRYLLEVRDACADARAVIDVPSDTEPDLRCIRD